MIDRSNETPKTQWRILPVLGIIILTIMVASLFLAIMLSKTSLSTPQVTAQSTESAIAPPLDDLSVSLLTSANERLLQMVQWTLGLVITVAALLVGFSWFQTNSRRQDDRQDLKEHKEELAKSLSDSISLLQTAVDAQSHLISRLESNVVYLNSEAVGPRLREFSRTLEDAISRETIAGIMNHAAITIHHRRPILGDDYTRYIIDRTISAIESLLDRGVNTVPSLGYMNTSFKPFPHGLLNGEGEGLISKDVLDRWDALFERFVPEPITTT